MMKIEKLLTKMAEHDLTCGALAVVAVNKGFSVVPLDAKFYAEHLLKRPHYNGPSVAAAIQELFKAKRFKTQNILRGSK
jgi:hypothetical protein